MDIDVTVHKGDTDRPVVIFIHGLGMDKNFWVDPLETKVFARNIPMKVLASRRPVSGPAIERKKLTAGTVPKKINNLWSALRDEGYNLICWSQSRPVGPINVGVEELAEIIKEAGCMFPGKSIAIAAHSRGGLIARKFMEKKCPEIKALITLCTPHHGSSLSRLEKYISPLHPFLKRALPAYTHGTVAEIMKRTQDLLQGDALKELVPGSEFFKNLKDAPRRDVRYLSFGGKKTKLLTVYRWKEEDGKVYPKPLLDIPDSIIKVLPASVIPPELIHGKGDFMVTAGSAVMPWAEQHIDLQANHISVAWNRKVIKTVSEALAGM